MGIFGKLFGGKDNDNSDQPSSGGTYLVEDTFRLNIPQDLVVVGKINGTVREGDKVCVEGADENNLISVKELNIFRTKVSSATDTQVALYLENGIEYGIEKGTVLKVKT
jgi:translation elongation factor EF-Tu-like GTPase